jgi:predicted nucleotidyltransferase
MNKLILGDCLEVLQKLEKESIDLIYIDPPFFSNKTYEVSWGNDGEFLGISGKFVNEIEKMKRWLHKLLPEIKRVLSVKGMLLFRVENNFLLFVESLINKFFKYSYGHLKWNWKEKDKIKYQEYVWFSNLPQKRSYRKNLQAKTQEPEREALQKIIKLNSKKVNAMLAMSANPSPLLIVANKNKLPCTVIALHKQAFEDCKNGLEQKKIIVDCIDNSKLLDKSLIINKLKEEKQFLVQQLHIQKIGLFGSFAANTQRYDSDMDFWVEFDNETTATHTQAELYLTQLFNTPIDIPKIEMIRKKIKSEYPENILFAF